jgi:hypothetical protein
MDIWLLGLWIQYRVTQEGLLLLSLFVGDRGWREDDG